MLALAWLNTQNFKDTGLFRVSLGQKCNSSRIRDQECMEAAANYEHCGSSSLKRAGLSYPRERFDCNGLVFRILLSLPPTPSASQRLHLRAPTHNQVNRVFSLKKMRNRDALSFWGCGGTSDVVANRHTRHRSGQLRAVHFRADSATLALRLQHVPDCCWSS